MHLALWGSFSFSIIIQTLREISYQLLKICFNSIHLRFVFTFKFLNPTYLFSPFFLCFNNNNNNNVPITTELKLQYHIRCKIGVNVTSISTLHISSHIHLSLQLFKFYIITLPTNIIQRIKTSFIYIHVKNKPFESFEIV